MFQNSNCLNFEHIKTESRAVSVDENVFLFGGFDHNRGANFGKNTTQGTGLVPFSNMNRVISDRYKLLRERAPPRSVIHGPELVSGHNYR